MKKMFLIITLLFSLSMLATTSTVTKSDKTLKEFVQVVDVGYMQPAITLNQFKIPGWQNADVQDEQTIKINLTKQIVPSDYCEPLMKDYYTGIGKTLLIENIKVQKYRILYFQVNGILPNSTIRLCN